MNSSRAVFVTLFILSSNILLSRLYLVECFNDFLHSYQTLSYRPISSVDRFKRSTIDSDIPSTTRFRFQAYSRVFYVVLHPRSYGIFADDHVLEINGKEKQFEPQEVFFDGFLAGDSGSTVHGSVIDGVFDGHIKTGDGKLYTVEKTSRYFAASDRPSKYHSIIYADADIYSDRFSSYRMASNLLEDGDRTNRLPTFTSTHLTCGVAGYTDNQQMQKLPSSPLSAKLRSSQKRSENIGLRIDPGLSAMRMIRGKQIYEVRSCSVHIQVDHKLYEMIYEREGNQDISRTSQEIMSLVGNHIGEVNRVFKNTNFGGIKGINFVIQRTKIYNSDSCSGSYRNPFCVENIDISNYLDILSSQNHDDFCLAYALTYRDFTGILGLAWVAKPDSTPGGVCEPHHRTGSAEKGQSLNTGVITLVNYGRRVPLRTSALTLAHEIGHNFGASHDDQPECLPGGEGGNFIMFPKANDGYKSNNEKFSDCSRDAITSVLFSVLHEDPDTPLKGRKRNCFHQGDNSFCGNQIVEEGEQCDCGFDKTDCDIFPDQCCSPGECKLKFGKRCSPSGGTCCNDHCNPLPEGTLCGISPECRMQRSCDGLQAKCPEGIAKTDGTLCLSSTKIKSELIYNNFWVCFSGECSGSVCAEVGLRDCFLTEGKPEKLCHLACVKNGVCTSSYELEEFRSTKFIQEDRMGQFGLRILPGQPCKNFTGFCDIMYKCRNVDSNGPLARLKAWIFDLQNISALTNWMERNWWACISFVVLFASSMCLCVKFCAVDTPKSNPVRHPANKHGQSLRHVSAASEIRRLHDTSNSAMRVPPIMCRFKSVRFAVGQVRLPISSSSEEQ